MPGKPIDECPRFNPDALYTVRRKRKLSREGLGNRINQSRQTIRRWETGENSPTARHLRALSHVLRVPPAELLYPTLGEPTLADLRMDRALTPADLAVRSATNLDRLLLWELTGRLGTDDEQPLLLATFLGISRCSVEQYVLTGVVPEAITYRLARVLHVKPAAIQAAFDRTTALYDTETDDLRTAS